MRIRCQCDKCDYKTTSKEVHTQHMKVLHETKEKKQIKREETNKYLWPEIQQNCHLQYIYEKHT